MNITSTPNIAPPQQTNKTTKPTSQPSLYKTQQNDEFCPAQKTEPKQGFFSKILESIQEFTGFGGKTMEEVITEYAINSCPPPPQPSKNAV